VEQVWMLTRSNIYFEDMETEVYYTLSEYHHVQSLNEDDKPWKEIDRRELGTKDSQWMLSARKGKAAVEMST
jgi:hypothetical protein